MFGQNEVNPLEFTSLGFVDSDGIRQFQVLGNSIFRIIPNPIIGLSTEDNLESAEEIAEEPGDEREEDEFPNILADGYDPDAESQDNLKKIKGIGPAIEKTLNGLGIYRFNQIAEMSEYDIDRVAQQLKGFRSRIYREDWVGQARTLQYEKNNP